jgi:hypothetical protein
MQDHTAAEAEALEAMELDSVVTKLVTAEDYLREGMNGYHDLGNFSGFFISPDSMVAAGYYSKPCRQRFAFLFPDLTVELELLTAGGEATNAPTRGKTLWRPHEAYFQAYDLMALLVDRKDENVVVGGKVDRFYLVR